MVARKFAIKIKRIVFVWNALIAIVAKIKYVVLFNHVNRSVVDHCVCINYVRINAIKGYVVLFYVIKLVGK
jgi:hypothetical protein